MHQRNSAFATIILQVKIKLTQLVDQKHAFIYHRATAKRCHIAVLLRGRLFKFAAHYIKQAVKVKTCLHVFGARDQRLADKRHAFTCFFAQDIGVSGHGAPCCKGYTAPFANTFKSVHKHVANNAILRKEKHAHANVACITQRVQVGFGISFGVAFGAAFGGGRIAGFGASCNGKQTLFYNSFV